MAEPDPYQVLGVSKNAADAEIKRAFRKKARQFHPDRNPGDTEAEKEDDEKQKTKGQSKGTQNVRKSIGKKVNRQKSGKGNRGRSEMKRR